MNDEWTRSRDLQGAERFDRIEAIAEDIPHSAFHTPQSAEGWAWEAEMLKPGFSLNRDLASGLPRYYPPEFIRAAAPLFEGAPAFADHPSFGGGGSVRDLVGKWQKVRLETRGLRLEEMLGRSAPQASGLKSQASMVGELHLLESEDWLRQKLLAAQKASLPIGVSINAYVAFDRATREGREVMEAKRIIAELPRSVDVVTVPGAGGRVLRAVASGTDFESAQAALAAAREKFCRSPQSSMSQSSMNQSQIRSDHGAKGATMQENTTPAPDNGAITQASERIQSLERRVQEADQRQRAAEARLLLSEKLEASRLPAPLANLVRERVEQPAPAGLSAEEIEAEIARVREAYAAVVPNATRLSRQAGHIELGSDSAEKMQIALDRLLGVTHEWREVREGSMVRWVRGNRIDGAIPGFRGIQEAYLHIAGDRDLRWYAPAGASHLTEEWNAAGFASSLGNTLYRRMVQDYEQPDYGLDLLAPPVEPHRVALRDFRTHEIVRVGYLGDLTEVNPEVVDWPEIAAPTDEKATITAVQFGGLITVTRKAIINDDIGLVAKVAARAGRAARRTLARRVIKKLIVDNPVIYDGVAFFSVATHVNQRTGALAANELNSIRQAMRDQTEKDSGEKLGVAPSLLLAPHALEGTARQENMREFLDASFTPNPVRFLFGDLGQRIIVSPLLTDANDFFCFADPREIQTFELGFLQGREQPELLLADSQVVGKAFTSDRIQYKIRHEYEATVVDFRGAHKNAVP